MNQAELTARIISIVRPALLREGWFYEALEGWLQADSVDWRLSRQPRTAEQVADRARTLLAEAGEPVSEVEMRAAMPSLQISLNSVQHCPLELGNSLRKRGR